MKTSMLGIGAVIMLSALEGCRNSSPGVLQEVPGKEPEAWTHRILTYGDSRTGVYIFEDQANTGQVVHAWLVKKMLERVGSEKASVVFTGDAVYAGGSSGHWATYLKAIEAFHGEHIAYYPCIGNHELMAAIFGTIAPYRTAREATAGETLRTIPLSVTNVNSVAEGIKEWEELLRQREELAATAKATPAGTERASAKQLDEKMGELKQKVLPQLETLVYSKAVADRAIADKSVMYRIYVERAGFAHLKEIFDTATYYGVELVDKRPHVRLLFLDTNILDADEQKAWFESQVAQSGHDIIIAFGHHPPVTKKHWLVPYILGERPGSPVLWVFSHMHCFESYLFGEPASRALFVSGGGGASLDPAKGTCKEVLSDWKYSPGNPEAGRVYHFLDIRVSEERVWVTVVGSREPGGAVAPLATYELPVKDP